MSSHKKPERRTYLQDRLEILITKQKSGTASFNELTELDDIVNRDPAIREMIIMDNFFPDDKNELDQPGEAPDPAIKPAPYQSLLNRLKSLIDRIFNIRFFGFKSVSLKDQALFI
jgi:hypothetical protein